jgi:hypothetical protein
MSSRTFDLSCIGVLTASLVACGGGGGGGGGNGPSRTLTAVTITGNTTFTSAGQTSQLAARAQYSDSTSDDVTTQATWSSSNQAVATVSATGLVTSQSGGTSATITATFQSVTGSAGVTVAAPPVQQLAITGNTIFTTRNQTSQLTATATLAGGATQNVTATAVWAVSNTSVASVSSSALLTAGANGLSEVSATFMGTRATRTIETRWADCQSNGIRFNAGVGSGAYEALATQGCQSCHRAGSSGGRWDFNRAATDVYNTALLLVRPREAGNSTLAQFGQTFGGHPGAASVNPCYPGSWCGDAIRNWIAGGACPPR